MIYPPVFSVEELKDGQKPETCSSAAWISLYSLMGGRAALRGEEDSPLRECMVRRDYSMVQMESARRMSKAIVSNTRRIWFIFSEPV